MYTAFSTDGSVAAVNYTPWIILFDVLQVLALAFLGLMLGTSLVSVEVSRSMTWRVFIAAVMEWCLSYIIMFGHQGTTNPPVFDLCIFQAAAIYGSNPLVTCAALGLVFELHLRLSATIFNKKPLGKTGLVCILLCPFVMYFAIFFWVISFGYAHQELVQLDLTNMYCHIESPGSTLSFENPFIVSAAVTLVLEVLIFIFSIWTAVRLFRHSSFAAESSSPFSRSMFIRRNTLMAVLSVVGIAMAATSFIKTNPYWNLALTIMPLATAALFGTHKNFLHAWAALCRRRTPDRLKYTQTV